jgi:hypothetical protein
VAALQHHDFSPGPGQVRGGGEPIVATADDDDVVHDAPFYFCLSVR